jgi:hypothetical protein
MFWEVRKRVERLMALRKVWARPRTKMWAEERVGLGLTPVLAGT